MSTWDWTTNYASADNALCHLLWILKARAIYRVATDVKIRPVYKVWREDEATA